ncbi:MAG: right-handed parallel beta-helix repeat-containing protein [Planctomycetota bacterium]|jgi:hypothetical protein
MADVANPTIQRAIPIVMLITLLALSPARVQSQDGRPIADAGLSRYAATDPVQLDGTGSYDPDDFGPLSYTWRQIAGPSVEATDTDTAAPTINGFTQTDEIQECEFELIVNNGEYDSLPDTVRVVVVPDFGESNLRLENKSFDPNKPTIIYFGGGDCTIGYSGQYVSDPDTLSRANVIDFPNGYTPDSGGGARTYYKYGDMIIAYLSSLAPDYKQPIQSSGWSTGGQPAIDVGICLNQTYRDARYAVNQVTFLDATPFCRDYSASISTFLGSSVDGEQCWADNYVGTTMSFHPGILNVSLSLSHSGVLVWYGNSLASGDMKKFNHGVVAGTYWSPSGPGKNLQLASTPNAQTYKFRWYGDESSGYMDFFDELNHPGRLPEPVTLLAYSNALEPNDEPTGALLTCEESENAVGYQLLFGTDPYRVMDYNIVSDTPAPPTEIITIFPFEETWWTVRAYDQYGSTIYADPIRVELENLPLLPPINNLTNGKGYSSIQFAINDANSGDEIVVGPGIYQENISFKSKNLTLRSTEPNESTIVATTIIVGDGRESVVTFSGGEDVNCVLAGFTITCGKYGIYCSGASPTITNCTITGNVNAEMGAGICLKNGSNPMLVNCTAINNSGSLMGGGLYNENSSPTLSNCVFSGNSAIYFGGGICSSSGSLTITNCILWGDIPEEISFFSGTPVITYSNIQGGFTGEGNIDTDPLFADPDNGDYHLKSQTGRWDCISQTWIQDDVTSPCIDAGDPTSLIGLEPSPNSGRINMGAYGGTSEASKSP